MLEESSRRDILKVAAVAATAALAATACGSANKPATPADNAATAVSTSPKPANTPQPKTIVVRAAHLVDPHADTVRDNPAVVIDGERITEIRYNGQIPAGAHVIDLGSATLLPGLIDCHTHLTGDPCLSHGDYYESVLKIGSIDNAIMASTFAKRTLDAGFTTVRDVGALDYVDVALRNAINHGDIPGPRMLVAGPYIGATGGGADRTTGYSPRIEFHEEDGLADGVDAIRHRVRENVKNGVDVIKFIASGAVLSGERSVGAPAYAQEEMNAIVDEAHRWEKRVAAHAIGTEAIKMAIHAGADSIEHSSLIDDEGLELARKHGTYLVFNLYTVDYIIENSATLDLPPAQLEKAKQVRQQQQENFRRAVEAGRKIAFGTDAGVLPHGWNGKQFAVLTKAGMTPMQAIQAATVNAADLLGMNNDIGAAASGYYADLIAVTGDPIKDVSQLEHVGFVMKSGIVSKDENAGK